jgi:hypothetical protein
LIDSNKHFSVDSLISERERIASKCVCCNSDELTSSPAILMPFIADRVFGWKPVIIDESWGLKSIKIGSAYSICNSLQCSQCGLLFLDMRFTDNELKKLYKNYREKEYVDLRDFYEPGYKERNNELALGINYTNKIEQFLQPFLPSSPRVLDWGGGTGLNTPFKEKNKLFDIYEIGESALIPGAQSISKKEIANKNYDLVVLSNVLEHVPYPIELLLDIKNMIQGEAVLYIEIPFEDIMKSQKTNPHYFKKHWHEHINFFSEQSIIKLINRCDLKLLSMNQLQASAGGASNYLIQIACELKQAS